MNLSDIYVFKKIASTLSFSEAARQAHLSRSAVSKQLNRLERDLGVVLVNRSTRSVCLTEAGRSFHQNTDNIDTTVERAVSLVRGTDLSAEGTVSLGLPTSIGVALIPSLAVQFQTCWPEVRLDIQFSDKVLDMISAGLDLAIRIAPKLDDSSLISRRLITTNKVLAASPRYLEKHGAPRQLEDLEKHRCLSLGRSVIGHSGWKFVDEGKSFARASDFALSANNNMALIMAACSGAGIIFVPKICIASELARKQLQIIPGIGDSAEYGVYAIYPHRNTAAKVQVLIDFIEQMLKRLDMVDRQALMTRDLSSENDAVCNDEARHDTTNAA